MGACTFVNVAAGPNARAAFDDLVDLATAQGGGRCCCGTIAGKRSFTMIPLPAGVDPKDPMALDKAIDALIAAEDPRIDDKWGPAGCFDLGDGRFAFFGWAPE